MNLQGSIVALVTPMFEDGDIDFESLEKLVHWHIEQGTDAIVSVGTTGESATLDFDEHREVIAKTIEFAAGRVPIIAGTGANSTSEAIELTQSAADLGADACLLVTPYYNKPTQEGLYHHYKTIAEAVAIPQILYNVPGRTAVDMSHDTVLRLAEIDNIIGNKEASGSVERVAKLAAACPNDFAVLSGDDDLCKDMVLAGAKGVISVTANVAPAQFKAMMVAALAKDQDIADEIHNTLTPLYNVMFVESNPIPVKWALTQLGKIRAGIRLPLTTLSTQWHDNVSNAIRSL